MKLDGSPDFESDFLQWPTEVGWGARGWVAIQLVQPINGSISTTFQIDFPDSAGGTPGLIPFNGVQPGFGPSGAAAYVRTPITGPYQASWIGGTLTTNGGQSFTGFAAHDPTPFNTIHVNTFLKLNGQLPGSTFRLRITGIVATIGGHWDVVVLTGRQLKVGDTGLPSPVVSTRTSNDNPTGATLEFTVDPFTLEVTGP